MKTDQIHKWIKYYRNSLADGELLDIKTKECEEGTFYNSLADLNSENLIELYKEFNKSTRSQKQESEPDIDKDINYPLNVFIAPFYLNGESSHSKKFDNVQKVFPFWIPATLSEFGELTSSPEENKLPWFIRSVLEPVCTDSNYFPTISSLHEIDKTLDHYSFNYETWKEYWQSAERFFEKVTGNEFKTFRIDGFVTHNTICIIKAKEVVTAQNILRIYEDLINTDIIPILTSKLLSFQNQNRKELPDEKELFLSKGHYGQYNNQFSLSNSQRKSLLVFEKESDGNILAVNGPPGTGKTTILQSVVANEVVKAALKGVTPPKIVASSTNNQAITNILDSFGGAKDSPERWLPNITSLGSYLISSNQKKQDIANKKGYQILTRANDNLDGYYFNDLHNSDINELEKHYVACFLRNYDADSRISIHKIIEVLKSNIKIATKKIDSVINTIHNVNKAELQHFPLIQLPEFNNTIEQLCKNLSLLENEKERILLFRNNFNNFRTENRLLIFFNFIPSLKQSFKRKLSLFLIDSPNEIFKNLTSNQEVETVLLNSFKINGEQITLLKSEIEKNKELYNYLVKLKSEYDAVQSELSELWEIYLKSKSSKDKEQIESECKEIEFYEKANRILDISFRYSAFINAIHYWEGLWILKQQNEELKINKGLASRDNVFSRISYLTPLYISTFHSLPSFCSYFEKTLDKWIQKPIYNLFDLIIVDEAGQVSPEVGIASFSLAKKALVVGDIYQIEPVWNIAYERIDIGNLREVQILKDYNFVKLKEWGVLCSSGSLMHLAQKSSSFEINSNIGGTLLTEHRRCVDELVAFSNHYVYNDMLKPMVGSSKGVLFKDDNNEIFIPPLSYLNIRGISEKRSGSTFNKVEAESIAKWIYKYGYLILEHYNKGKSKSERKELKDCIAVITPFSEQKNEIYRQFKTFKIDDRITVGTVHALQGAERPIVIFSPSYGVNQSSNQLFFDIGFNMLNVALTRAKQHFIVMGNMSLFNPLNIQKPSGGLAKYLFSDALNELSSSFLFDSKPIGSENRVDTLEKHQKCLKRAFEAAKKRVVIISPFISIHAIQADNLLQEVQKAILNNIEVLVYTDKNLDMPNGKLKKNTDEGRKALIEAGAKINILSGIHNKALVIDEDVLIEGSFNWLSAVRDKQHPHYRYEVSQILQGNEAKLQIAQLLNELSSIPN